MKSTPRYATESTRAEILRSLDTVLTSRGLLIVIAKNISIGKYSCGFMSSAIACTWISLSTARTLSKMTSEKNPSVKHTNCQGMRDSGELIMRATYTNATQ